ncbi:class I SAM-dependent methyltransferase [Flavobacterium salmonis]|uniref:Methyltransferase domain-containing protein n=1 Tax=Flavobacterium salmonis TaxID=2654844 RepID=A0A6V6ZAC0_9FLAO|nr:class I SAM-dependent methyltransferase [Flavobacterium salmonis]CAD0008496.1 hypothetical protein FLAT13_04419 [Flavobacterium salmonis]
MIHILKKIKSIIKSSKKGNFSCSVCNKEKVKLNKLSEKYLRAFDDAGFIHSIFLFETLNIFEYSCANCSASDRSRLYALYLNEFFKKGKSKIKVLDIAPTEHFKNYLNGYINQMDYRSADLYMQGVDDIVDIQNMTLYPDGTWDLVICSHVLEHVKDDMKAVTEIYRVLKKGGVAILMAPINLGLEESIEAEKNREYTITERWKYFGQDDHERLYSKKDFINRIRSVGFELDELDVEYFGEAIFKKYGINKKSVLYIAKKND